MTLYETGRRPIVAIALAAPLACLWIPAIAHAPASDYPNQRTAARAYLASFNTNAEPGEWLYDWIAFQRWSERDGNQGQLGTYIPQPPAALLPYVPFCRLGTRTGKVLFAIASFLVYLPTFHILARRLEATAFESLLALAALGGAIAANLRSGQEMLLVGAFLNLALAAPSRDVLAGAAIGAASALKLFGLPLLIPILVARRLRLLAALTATVVLMTTLATAGFGLPMLAAYLRDVLPESVAGNFHNLYHPASQSIETTLRRLLLPHPDWNPAPPFPAPHLYGALARAIPLGILGLALAAALRQEDSGMRPGPLGLLLVATLAAAPTVNRYHLVAVAPALLFTMVRARGTWKAPLALGAVTIASFAPQGRALVLQEPRVAGVLALYVLLLTLLPLSRAAASVVLVGALGIGLAFPVRREPPPASWQRVTAVPFVPLYARFPDREGRALELQYADSPEGTRFRFTAPLPAVDIMNGLDMSPDGRHMARVARPHPLRRVTEIRERDRETLAERVLVPAVAFATDPRYSADGHLLYFASDAGRCAGCTVIYRVAR